MFGLEVDTGWDLSQWEVRIQKLAVLLEPMDVENLSKSPDPRSTLGSAEALVSNER